MPMAMRDKPTQDTALLDEMREMGAHAKEAAHILALATDDVKNKALKRAAAEIRGHVNEILEANAEDIFNFKTRGGSGPMLDRLTLNDARIEAMAKGLEDIALLGNPVGKTLAEWTRPNGLNIARVSVPLGVVGIIYESRPNVTSDAAGLCLKSGNAAILRCGSESFFSSTAIMNCLQKGLLSAGLPKYSLQLVATTNRDAVGIMLGMSDVIDVIIPRGGRGLTERVQKESRIPTLLHLEGNCHTYIHAKADKQKAIEVLVNAKMRRTGICGATESLVIDRAIAGSFLPAIVDALSAKGCQLRGDAKAVAADARITPATEEDFKTEYLDAILSVKVVEDVEEAIFHINHYGSQHTESIITEDENSAARFLREVDSAIVMHNASTQFADGGEFGMGAEIGIATGKLHARGPVGVEQLTTFKYLVRGSGQVRPE